MARDYDLILHMDADDEKIFKIVAANARNYLNALPDKEFEVRIVVNAGAVKLFVAEREDLRALAAPLAKDGVKFLLCANALAANNIDRARLWPFCEVVPAGVVEIVRLEREGYAYIKP